MLLWIWFMHEHRHLFMFMARQQRGYAVMCCSACPESAAQQLTARFHSLSHGVRLHPLLCCVQVPIVASLVDLPLVSSLLQGFLPSLVLLVFLAVAPYLLKALIQGAGLASMTAIDAQLIGMYFLFQLVSDSTAAGVRAQLFPTPVCSGKLCWCCCHHLCCRAVSHSPPVCLSCTTTTTTTTTSTSLLFLYFRSSVGQHSASCRG